MELLKDKCVLVTGSSRGIGASIAKTLADHGAKVAVTYSRSEDSAKKVVDSLKGDGHLLLKLDISDPESIDQSTKTFLDHFGRYDALVNNAGITADQLIMRMKSDDFDRVIQTNLRGSFLCAQAAVKPMMKARNGVIINLTSVIAHTGNPGQTNYAASKAGLEGFSRSLAQELSSRNIRVNCVAPGFIATEMTDAVSDKMKEQISSRIPLGRMGSPEDVAHVVKFLISEEANYLTGQTIHVNGGLYMN